MSLKLGRNYILTVQNSDGSDTVVDFSKAPFTLEFDITRNTYSSTNVASIRVFNLKERTRNLLRKDVTNLYDNRRITLDAGYGTNLSTIFTGNVTQAWSVREGVNFISSMESFDGGFAFVTGRSDVGFPANTPLRSVLTRLVEDLPGIALGAIGDSFDGDIGPRGNSYSGNTRDLLASLSNGQFFVDSGKAYFLANNECIDGSFTIVNADSGLLQTPQRETALINFDMIFEPRVICGQFVQLDSSTDQSFNGAYKITSIKHRGVISPVISGDAITSLGLDNSTKALQIIPTEVAA
jgi:hypothetical protein